MSAIRYYRRLAPGPILLLALLLSACGSSSSNGPPAADGPAVPEAPAARETGTARFDVDVDSGQVQVTPLGRAEASGEAGNRAVFNGSAVSFTVSQLVDQPGSSGIRILNVSLTNRFGAAIGREYLRVVISHLTTGNQSTSDLRKQVQVSGTSIGLSGLRGLTFAPDGSYLVARVADNRIHRVQNNQATVFTGRATAGYSDGAPEAAQFKQPNDVVFHAAHNAYYVADTGNHRLRRVDLNGRVTTVAGTGTAGATNGPGNTATLNAPQMLDVDRNGAIVVTTADGRVRRITLGSGSPSLPASYTVATLASGLTAPAGIAAAPDGSLYVAERTAHRIRLIGASGSRVVIAGTGTAGQQDGAGDIATFRSPVGLAWVRGALVVADSSGHKIRLLTLAPGTQSSTASNWRVVNIAGAADGTSGNAIGQGNVARFNAPWGLRGRDDGTVVFTDVQNNAVRRLGVPDGALSTGVGNSATGEPVQIVNAGGYYGTPTGSLPYFTYDIRPDMPLRTRQLGGVQLDLPAGATTDPQEWWFNVPDRVRTFSFIATVEASTTSQAAPEGSHGATNPRVRVQTVIGASGHLPFTTLAERDGPADQATVDRYTRGLAVDPDGVVYLASQYTIRRFDPRTNEITTIAGHAQDSGNVAGPGDVARFDKLYALTAPRRGVVYVGEESTVAIHLVRHNGGSPTAADNWTVSRILGTGVEGLPTVASPTPIITVQGLASTSERDIWFTDDGNHVWLATCGSTDLANPANWRATILAGDAVAITGASGDSEVPSRFSYPSGIAVGRDRAAYVADTYNRKIRRVTDRGVVSTFVGPPPGTIQTAYVDGPAATARFLQPIGLASDSAGYLYCFDASGLRRISPTGHVSTVVRAAAPSKDGFGPEASVTPPPGDRVSAIGVAPDGDVWFIDHAGLRRVSRVIESGSP